MTHLITTYLKKNRKPISFYVVFLTMFYLVLYLYGVRADALGYAVFLSLVTFTVLGIFDFWRYQARIKAIGEAFRNMPYELGSLPAPLDIPEEKYQEEVRTLGERLVAQENDARKSRQEMIDFYSLWAHQIKTPLAALDLLLQSAEAREDAAQADPGDAGEPGEAQERNARASIPGPDSVCISGAAGRVFPGKRLSDGRRRCGTTVWEGQHHGGRGGRPAQRD